MNTWKEKTLQDLYLAIRKDNYFCAPAHALAAARLVVQAQKAGFDFQPMHGGVGVVWGGAVWAWCSRTAWENGGSVYSTVTMLGNAVKHRDNVSGWASSYGVFGGVPLMTSSVKAAVCKGIHMLGLRSKPRWWGTDGVYVDVALGVDAALAWCDS